MILRAWPVCQQLETCPGLPSRSTRKPGPDAELLKVRRVIDGMTDARDAAARRWFGYGRWDAPYWFVGMEPGGTDDNTSYDVWRALGGTELIDCRKHHLCSGYTRWHCSDRPPTQSTWRRLIQALLAFKGEPTDMDAVSRYQRDCFGSEHGETAVIELSALNAPNIQADVERTVHRDARIEDLRKRIETYQPRFAIFYGTTYRHEYARVAGTFGTDGTTQLKQTLCVLIPHPTAPGGPAPAYWIALGQAIRGRLEGDAAVAMPSHSAFTAVRSSNAQPVTRQPPSTAETAAVYVIRRGVSEVGRILYDGWHVRVERRDSATGSYTLLGYYENTRPPQWPRKTRELDDVFDSWSIAQINDPARVKVVWRARQWVSAFAPPPNAIATGCSIVEENGVEIARIYKLPENHATWTVRSSP